MERPPKAEPECLSCCGVVVKREESGSDVSSKLSEVVETANAAPLSPSMRHDDPRPASKKAKVLPAPAFAYGLQPFRAVHDTMPHSTSVSETLFCVSLSTSGRVVSHQRDDKVALFKVLREDLERIKAGTLDTGSMRAIPLLEDSCTLSHTI